MHEYYYVKDEKTFVYSWQKYFQAFKASKLNLLNFHLLQKILPILKKCLTSLPTLGVSVDKTG